MPLQPLRPHLGNTRLNLVLIWALPSKHDGANFEHAKGMKQPSILERPDNASGHAVARAADFALWLCGFGAFQLCDSQALGLSGLLAFELWGFVTLGLSGFRALCFSNFLSF